MTEKYMDAVLFYAPLDIRFEKVKIPEPKEGEVLVKIKAALTCGTDLKTYRRGHPVLIKSTPSGFGHEFSGIIEKVGAGVSNFKAGQRVVAANSAPCGECFFCKKGEYNLCENLEFLNGAYAQYITIPKRIVEKNLYIIPDNVSFEEAAFVEPLSNVIHGAEKAEIKEGMSVGIIGLGPIGLMFAKVAKIRGAKVITAARNPLKLELAKTFADTDKVINAKQYDYIKEFIEFSDEKMGLDVAVDCVGLPEIWEQLPNSVRKGGTVMLFGGCKSGTTVTFDTKRLHYDEVKLVAAFHHTPKYIKAALDMISEKKIDVKKLITCEMPLAETKTALEMQGSSKAVKIVLKP
ncbi:alcohol dehydrogenase catalytic domain-containing protein [bacterium]|nr:alcohol dehydrogenase catalytic domain-containing protein [bacterium]